MKILGPSHRDIVIGPWSCLVLRKSVKIKIFSPKAKVLMLITLCCVELRLLHVPSVSSLSRSFQYENQDTEWRVRLLI